MIRPLIVAQGLKIPTFAIFDADGDKILKTENRTRHHRDNVALLLLLGGDENDTFPTGPVWGDRFVAWPSDLGQFVETEFCVYLGVQGNLKFDALKCKANAKCGLAGGLEKNAIYIGSLLSLLKEEGTGSGSLDQLCEEIINFGA